MYVVFLRFGPHRAQASQWMAAHAEWIQRGIDDGVFLMAGSLDDSQGGALLAVEASREALLARIQEDPFVTHGVVQAEVQGITASRGRPDFLALLDRPASRANA